MGHRKRTILAFLGCILAVMPLSLAGCGGDSEVRVVVDGDEEDPATIDAAAVFIADKLADERFELFAVNRQGTEILRLSGPLDENDDVTSFALSPDRTRVAFGVQRNRFEETSHELFVTRTAGGELDRIGDLGVEVNFHHRYEWAPDSGRIAFIAPEGIFTALPDGDDLQFIAESGNFLAWSPAGDRLAFRAEGDLFTALADGTGLVRVGSGLVGSLTANYEWAPNASRIAFAAVVSQIDGELGLFTVFPDGTDQIRVGGPINSLPLGSAGRFSPLTLFRWAPDSEFIAFAGGVAPPAIPQEETDLFTARPQVIAGDREIASRIKFSEFDAFQWSPLGARIAFLSDDDRDNRFQLVTATPLGFEQLTLTGPLIFDGPLESYAWSPPAGGHIAFIAARDTSGPFDLFVSLFEGSRTINLSSLVNGTRRVEAFAWSPTGTHIAFAVQEQARDFTLFTALPDGGEAVEIAGGLLDPETAPFAVDLLDPTPDTFQFSVDGSRIYFIADPNLDGMVALFSARAGGTDRVRLSGSLVSGGGVVQFAPVQ